MSDNVINFEDLNLEKINFLGEIDTIKTGVFLSEKIKSDSWPRINEALHNLKNLLAFAGVGFPQADFHAANIKIGSFVLVKGRKDDDAKYVLKVLSAGNKDVLCAPNIYFPLGRISIPYQNILYSFETLQEAHDLIKRGYVDVSRADVMFFSNYDEEEEG